MTQAQTKAIQRAQAEHIRVLGKGTVKSSGMRFYVVSGSNGASYFVGVVGDHLQCTCPAGKHGNQVCKHRAAAHLAIQAERGAQMVRDTLSQVDWELTGGKVQPRQMESMDAYTGRRESSVLARPVANLMWA